MKLLLVFKALISQADLLLLSSSEPLNLVYIETAELDGWVQHRCLFCLWFPVNPLLDMSCWCPPSETNLKVKQALTVTGDMGDNISALAGFTGDRLTHFSASASWLSGSSKQNIGYSLVTDLYSVYNQTPLLSCPHLFLLPSNLNVWSFPVCLSHLGFVTQVKCDVSLPTTVWTSSKGRCR